MTQKNGGEEEKGLKAYKLHLVGATLLILSYAPEFFILGSNSYRGIEGNQKITMDLYFSQLDIIREMFLVIIGMAVYAAKIKRALFIQWIFWACMFAYFGLMVWFYAKIYCLIS